MYATIRITPALSAAATIASASRTVVHIGFSTKTCLPASAAAMVGAACEPDGHTITAVDVSPHHLAVIEESPLRGHAVLRADGLQQLRREVRQPADFELVVQFAQSGADAESARSPRTR